MQLTKTEQTSAQVIKINLWADKEDAVLMCSIADGDKAAMEEFVVRHIKRIKEFAARYVGSSSDEDDVVQETFFRVWTKASQWQDKKLSPINWLYRISYNLCIDTIRRQRKQSPKINIDEHTEQVSIETIATIEKSLPENKLADLETKKLLTFALEKLPERQRTAIILFHFHGQSNRDAAVIMDISVDALESLLSRGRRKLKEQLIGLLT